MPTPENIELQLTVNGGAPQTGVVTVDWEDVIVLKLADPDGVKRATYRIWDYPEDFAVPAGWTADASGLGYEVTVANGADAPPFTLPAEVSNDWGDFGCSVTVNNRTRNGADAPDLFDDTLIARLPSPSGIEDVLFGESAQRGDPRQWTTALKRMLRAVDSAINIGLPAPLDIANPAAVANLPYIDARHHGALTPNSSAAAATNKTTINAAITAANAASVALTGPVRVMVPAGLFWVTGLTLKANVLLVGSGARLTTLKLANSSNVPAIKATSVDNCGIQDLGFNGNQTNQATPAPGDGDGFRTVEFQSCNNVTLRNVRVDRAGTGAVGQLNYHAGVWIEGGTGHLCEDVEVFGDNVGTGFLVTDADHFSVVRLHVHDINYDLASDPGDDSVQGFWFRFCESFRVISPTVHNLGGDYGAGATTKYSRNPFSGCNDFDLDDTQVWEVDQGIDLTGSDGNTNFRIHGGCVTDCYSAGWKFANSARDGVVIGASAERCDLYGFFCSGAGELLDVLTGEITFINCLAVDTGGYQGTYVGQDRRPAGFAVEDQGAVIYPPTGIRFIHCAARDRQDVPTMKYGFMSETDSTSGNECIGCVSSGHTSAPFLGFAAADITWQPNAKFPTKGTIHRIELIEHFTSVSALHGMVASVSGTSASVADEDNTGSGRIGIGNCRTGTETTGRAGVVTRVNTLRFGGGRHRLRWDAQLASLSDGTDTFTTRLGFLDSVTGEPSNGAYFRYTHSVNGGEWQAVTRAAGVETATDTNVAATTSFASFEIEVNTAGTSVAFFIGGVLVATNTTNIPTGGNLTGIGASHIKSAGTNTREFRMDLMAYSFEPSTPL